jgi:hypothetical protein
MSSKKTATETQGLATSAEDQATMNKRLAATNPTLDYFMGGATGNPADSGLYKTMLTSGTEGTNQAYDNAKAANKLHSQVAGFGYETPTSQGADAGVEQARAADLSRVPGEALKSTINPALQAAGISSGQATTVGGQGGGYLSTAQQAEQARLARQQALWNSISQVGSMAVMGA